MSKKEKEQLHNNSFIESWYNAFQGIIYATTTQGNIKKQLLIIVIVMIVSLFFQLTKVEFLCLLFSVILIIITEMINTAIETVVDLYVDVYHPKAKIAKDVGAGAVVIAALNAVIIAYFLLYDKIGQLGKTVLQSLVNSPVHLAFTGIMLTIIALVVLKAANVVRKSKGIETKFIPSGQAALAFAVVTSILFNTQSMVVSTLAFVLAIIICENRIESKKRTVSEVFLGGCIGAFIVILVQALMLFKIG